MFNIAILPFYVKIRINGLIHRILKIQEEHYEFSYRVYARFNE